MGAESLENSTLRNVDVIKHLAGGEEVGGHHARDLRGWSCPQGRGISGQSVEERPSLLQILRIEPFGEPVIDLG